MVGRVLRRVIEEREARPVQRAAAQPVGRVAVCDVLICRNQIWCAKAI